MAVPSGGAEKEIRDRNRGERSCSMKKEVRLYNVILPIWLLWIFPRVWLIVLPGNLVVDCLVLTLTLLVLKHQNKKAVVKKLWWKFWLLGFLADFMGVAFLLLVGMAAENVSWLYDRVTPIFYNAFKTPAAFLVTLLGVGAAGVSIYVYDKPAMGSCGLLTERERHLIALTMAVVTAPWLFFVPLY